MLTALVFVGIGIYTVGVITTLVDLLKHGKSMTDYREKYGHDLGMLICCVSRGATIFAWPVVGFGGFLVGIVRDSVRLLMGRKPITQEK